MKIKDILEATFPDSSKPKPNPDDEKTGVLPDDPFRARSADSSGMARPTDPSGIRNPNVKPAFRPTPQMGPSPQRKSSMSSKPSPMQGAGSVGGNSWDQKSKSASVPPPPATGRGGDIAPTLRPSMDAAKVWHPLMQNSQFQKTLAQTKDLKQTLKKMPNKDYVHHFGGIYPKFKDGESTIIPDYKEDEMGIRKVAKFLNQHGIPVDPNTGKLLSAQKMPKLGEVLRGNKRRSKTRGR